MFAPRSNLAAALETLGRLAEDAKHPAAGEVLAARAAVDRLETWDDVESAAGRFLDRVLPALRGLARRRTRHVAPESKPPPLLGRGA